MGICVRLIRLKFSIGKSESKCIRRARPFIFRFPCKLGCCYRSLLSRVACSMWWKMRRSTARFARRLKARTLQACPLSSSAAHVCYDVYYYRYSAPGDEQIAGPPQLGHNADLCQVRRYVFGQRNEKV